MGKICAFKGCERGTRTHELCLYHRPKKAIKKVGKVTRAWIEKRKEWIVNNPPEYKGYWRCYICGDLLDIDNLTLDHIEPRSSRPDLRYDDSNLAPCCYSCNSIKGSKHD